MVSVVTGALEVVVDCDVVMEVVVLLELLDEVLVVDEDDAVEVAVAVASGTIAGVDEVAVCVLELEG